MPKRISCIFLCLSILLMASCSEKDPVAPTEAPILPPTESMKIDLSYFQNNNLAKNTGMTTKTNFANAAIRVAFINTAIVLTMSIPTAIFAAAASNQPVWDSDDQKFHWIYTVTYNQLDFKANLAGSIDGPGGEIVWEMYITSNATKPALQNFLWYEGRSKIGNASGWWLIYDFQKPTENRSLLRLDWSVQNTENTLIFKNVTAGDDGENDVLNYWVNATERKIDFWDNSKQDSLEIYWEVTKGTGYLTAADYIAGQKACWDENQNDVVCP